MSNKLPEEEQSQPKALSASRRSNTVRETISVYRLPEFDDDGRTDHLAEREFLATLPASADYERVIKRNHGAGHYRVEHRRNGQFKSVSEFHLDESSKREPVQVEDDESDFDAAEDERIEQIVKAALHAALEAQRAEFKGVLTAQRTEQPAATQQPSPAESLREAFNVLRELQTINAQLSPPIQQQPQLDEETLLTRAIVNNTGLLEKVISRAVDAVGRAEGQPDHWAVGLGKQLIDNVAPFIAPLIAPTIAAKFRAALENNQSAQTNPAQEEEANAADLALANMLENLAENSDVRDSAKEIANLIEEDEEAARSIEGLLSMPTPQLLNAIRANVPNGAHYASLPHAAAFIDNLKAAVEKRRQAFM